MVAWPAGRRRSPEASDPNLLWLQIDQQQDGPIQRLCRGAYVAAWLNAANTGWADAGSAGCGLAAVPFWKAVCLL
jgi:hypothetical protein